MKLLQYCLVASCLFFVIACGSKAATDQTGKEYTAAYICPMHCEGSGSDKPGKCPVCKMDYVKNENAKTETKDSHKGHNHDSHEGHDHGSHEGHNH